jgi:hypothetical protein
MGANTSTPQEPVKVPQRRAIPTNYKDYPQCKSYTSKCAWESVDNYLSKGGDFPTDDYAILNRFPEYHHKGYTSHYLQGIKEEEKERYLKLYTRFKQLAEDVVYNFLVFGTDKDKIEAIDPCVVYEGFRQSKDQLEAIYNQSFDTVRTNHYRDLKDVYLQEQRRLANEEEKFRTDQLAKEDPAEYAKHLFSGRHRRSPRYYGVTRGPTRGHSPVRENSPMRIRLSPRRSSSPYRTSRYY